MLCFIFVPELLLSTKCNYKLSAIKSYKVVNYSYTIRYIIVIFIIASNLKHKHIGNINFCSAQLCIYKITHHCTMSSMCKNKYINRMSSHGDG